ncbi:MAG: hypothetical protein WD673_15285 [Alphaproteobacteria bacterium]
MHNDRSRPGLEFKRKMLAERLQETTRHRRGIVALVAALGIVGFWRGTWLLLDIYLFPGNPVLSGVVSLLAGLGLLLVANYGFDDLA